MKGSLKRRLAGIASCIVIPIFCVGIVYYVSEKPNTKRNSFERKFTRNGIAKVTEMEVFLNSARISGFDEASVYFIDTVPGKMMRADLNLNGYTQLDFRIARQGRLFPFSSCIANGQMFYLAKMLPGILVCDIVSKQVTEYPLGNNYNQCVNISPKSFIAKVLIKKATGQDFFLSRLILPQGLTTVDTSLLPYKLDGGFYNDGTLLFDKKINEIIHVAYYRNEFICLDTNLNLVYRGKTIDTFRTTKIGVVKERSSIDTGSWNYTMSQPPQVINRKSCTDNGLLYIHSGLKSDNETMSDFRNNSVIDVYNLKNGAYLHSFYLPHFKGKKETDFKIKDNKLFALYDNTAVLYSLGPIWL